MCSLPIPTTESPARPFSRPTPTRWTWGVKSYPGRAGPKEGGRGAKEGSRGGEGVKVEEGMGSQEEGWKKNTDHQPGPLKGAPKSGFSSWIYTGGPEPNRTSFQT